MKTEESKKQIEESGIIEVSEEVGENWLTNH